MWFVKKTTIALGLLPMLMAVRSGCLNAKTAVRPVARAQNLQRDALRKAWHTRQITPAGRKHAISKQSDIPTVHGMDMKTLSKSKSVWADIGIMNLIPQLTVLRSAKTSIAQRTI